MLELLVDAALAQSWEMKSKAIVAGGLLDQACSTKKKCGPSQRKTPFIFSEIGRYDPFWNCRRSILGRRIRGFAH